MYHPSGRAAREHHSPPPPPPPSRRSPDTPLPQAPSDTISSLAWSPARNYLIATSWDKTIRCWEIGPNGQAVALAMQSSPQALLCCAWNAQGSHVYFAGLEGKVMQWDIASNSVTQVGAHQGAVSHMCYVAPYNCLVTGSWDKKLLFWNLTTPTPIREFDLGERCYALSYRDATPKGGKHILVVATAETPAAAKPTTGYAYSFPSTTTSTNDRERMVFIFDMANPMGQPVRRASPLNYQTRCLEVFHDGRGYLIGSIEGRVGVEYEPEQMDQKNTKRSFTFKAHRVENRSVAMARSTTSKPADVYAVNFVSVHPNTGTFATVGSDGRVCFWDKENKSSLNKIGDPSKEQLTPITTCGYNADGSYFAYARGYDWYMGPPPPGANFPVQLMLRRVPAKDIKKT